MFIRTYRSIQQLTLLIGLFPSARLQALMGRTGEGERRGSAMSRRFRFTTWALGMGEGRGDEKDDRLALRGTVVS